MTPSVLYVDGFSNTTVNMPTEQLAAIEQLYHNIMDQYYIPHLDTTGMMYCQPVMQPDTFENQNMDSASDDHHFALTGNAQLNFSICNKSNSTNSVTSDIEQMGMDKRKVLAMVGKYLKPLTICYDMGWQRCLSGT